MFKRACSRQLEAQLNTLQKDGPAAWADLPEEELFTPAGFSSQQGRSHCQHQLQLLGQHLPCLF